MPARFYQGDPLSGPIFNIGLEKGLHSLDKNVGFDKSNKIINSGAYADDTNLIAGTRRGLQNNMDAFLSTLKGIGLEPNAKKSQTISLVPSGKEKKMKVVTGNPFNIDGQKLKELSIEDFWKYLGVEFESKGPAKSKNTFAGDLESLT